MLLVVIQSQQGCFCHFDLLQHFTTEFLSCLQLISVLFRAILHSLLLFLGQLPSQILDITLQFSLLLTELLHLLFLLNKLFVLVSQGLNDVILLLFHIGQLLSCLNFILIDSVAQRANECLISNTIAIGIVAVL